MNAVHVQMLPNFLEGQSLAGQSAIVIDVLRASTTMIHALAEGAAAVIPCVTVEEARQQAAELPKGAVLLGGERRGLPIEGFDLGNSPLSYSREVVAGKLIVFTTTNGTRALQSCRSARRVAIGAFVNQSAVVRWIEAGDCNVQLVCAGTDGQLTAEDILFAGALVHDLVGDSWEIGNVQAQMALDFFEARSRTEETFLEAMFQSRGGQNLQKLGMMADIERAMGRDRFASVPVWDPLSGRILSGSS